MSNIIKTNKNILFEKLNDLKNLNLDEDDCVIRDQYVEDVGVFTSNFKFEESTEEEIKDAKRYNEVEIPLKKKAEILKRNHYILKTQLNTVIDNYNQFSLRAVKKEIDNSDQPKTPEIIVGGLRNLRLAKDKNKNK